MWRTCKAKMEAFIDPALTTPDLLVLYNLRQDVDDAKKSKINQHEKYFPADSEHGGATQAAALDTKSRSGGVDDDRTVKESKEAVNKFLRPANPDSPGR